MRAWGCLSDHQTIHLLPSDITKSNFFPAEVSKVSYGNGFPEERAVP